MSKKVQFRYRFPGGPWSPWQACFHNVQAYGWVITALEGINIDRVAWRRVDDGTAFEYRLKEQS